MSISRLTSWLAPKFRSRRRDVRLSLEPLEGREVPATFVVTNDGSGFNDDLPQTGLTLEQAIAKANANPGLDKIVFALNDIIDSFDGSVEHTRTTISVNTILTITDPVIIDGTGVFIGQDNPFAQGGFVIDVGTVNGQTTQFINMQIGVPQSSWGGFAEDGQGGGTLVNPFSVFGFAGPAITITEKGRAILTNNTIQGSGGDGILVLGGGLNAGSNIGGIGKGNTITGNSGAGIHIKGASATFNQIQGNTISNNSGDGILIEGASDTLIGDPTNAGGANTITGNVLNGVRIQDAARTRVQNNTVTGNFQSGLYVDNSPNTLIGGTQTNAKNNFSDNTNNGIEVVGAGSTNVVIQQNTINNNNFDGILLNGAPAVLIGGSASTAKNSINNNARIGIHVLGVGSSKAVIQNNVVNGNTDQGILVNAAQSVTIGGTSTTLGNTVSNNGKSGISLFDQINPDLFPTLIYGNNITGNDANAKALGDVGGGILLDGAVNVIIGSTATNGGNTINNNSNGVSLRTNNLTGQRTSKVTIQRNTFNANTDDGIFLDDVDVVRIGSAVTNGGNTISTSGANGIHIQNLDAGSDVTVQNNNISANTGHGILVTNTTGAKALVIGGTVGTLTRNIIGANARSGIRLEGGNVSDVLIANNYIGTNSTGTAANGNGEHGISIADASNNTIGGGTAGARNVISGNGINGIIIENLNDPFGTQPQGNVIQGNYIGTTANGLSGLGNGSTGILFDGTGKNLIGGSSNEGNIIAFNGGNGVAIQDADWVDPSQSSAAVDTTIVGNRIFSNALLAIDLPTNPGDGDLGDVTPNDPMDADTGPNNLQNYPVVVSASVGFFGTEVEATLNSEPNKFYRVDFFNDTDPNNPQARTYIGSALVQTDANGDNIDPIRIVPITPIQVGTFVSATATEIFGTTLNDPLGSTSELSPPTPVTNPTGQITGVKFNDLNGNGVQDFNEPGLVGWTINLDRDNDGTIDAKTTTGPGGVYTFDKLPAGVYKVSETGKAGWLQTEGPSTNPITVTNGTQFADFGNFQTVSISGVKFNDLDGDGVRDFNEPGLAGVVFQLYQVQGGTKTLLATSTSNAAGAFSFTNIGPASFDTATNTNAAIPTQPIGSTSSVASITSAGPIQVQVVEVVPPGYTQTTKNPEPFTITSGQNITGVQFGNTKGTIGSGGITIVVDNDGSGFDDYEGQGTMTFEAAVALANQLPGLDRIVFALPPIRDSFDNSLEHQRSTISINSTIHITDPVIIDGTGIDGFGMGTPFFGPGFSIEVGTVNGQTTQFINMNITSASSWAGFAEDGQGGGQLFGAFSVTGFNGDAIVVQEGGRFTITGSTISGHSGNGIRILGGGTNAGSNIGGIGKGNTITNNQGNGILIEGPNASFTQVQGNTITNNSSNGIRIVGAPDTLIGDPANAASRNTITGNVQNGIRIENSERTRVQNNTISDNFQSGVYVQNSPNTLIGGTQANANNTITNNSNNGVEVVGLNSTNVVLQQNTITGNNFDGILIDNAPAVTIGGSAANAKNNISTNSRIGIHIRGFDASKAVVQNNTINSNTGQGILVDRAQSVTIGGASTTLSNLISNNGKSGISLFDQINPDLFPTLILGNTISGNDANGQALGDIGGGILLDGAYNVQIGNTSTSGGNAITDNSNGVTMRTNNLSGQRTSKVVLQNNTISGNNDNGVLIDDVDDIRVGTGVTNGGNTITGSRSNGIFVRNIDAGSNIQVQNNIITTSLGHGILVNDTVGSDSLLIGGDTGVLTRNVISGNARSGIRLEGGNVSEVRIWNNYIGTNVAGTAANGNAEHGISIADANNNIIGGGKATQRNVISGNGINGILIENPPDPFGVTPTGNIIQGNFIGTNAAGTAGVGNGGSGILLDGTGLNLIGGRVDPLTKLDEGNVIAFNARNGVAIQDVNWLGDPNPSEAVGTPIVGNRIHDNGLLAIDLPTNPADGDQGIPTPNDILDQDAGPNNLQNYPEIISATSGLIGTVLEAKLNSEPFRTYRVDFFGDTNAANPQARTFLGSVLVTTDANGNNTAPIRLNSTVAASAGSFVSATATEVLGIDPFTGEEILGSTSELGEALQVTTATGSISGVKFNDLNGNGVMDAGEPGLPGWVIQLDANNDGTIDAKVITDTSGKYSFDALADGVYKLSEVAQAGWIQTAGPLTNPVQITGGVALTQDNDFGNFKLVTIRGVKFNDLNGDGIRDVGEVGLSGVVMQLWQQQAGKKVLLATSTTDLSGNYQFTQIGPASFDSATNKIGAIPQQPQGTTSSDNPIIAVGPVTLTVTEVVPTGYTQTTPNPDPFEIISGQDINNVDFGNRKGGGGGPGGTGSGNLIVVGSGSGPGSTGPNTGSTVNVFSATDAGKGKTTQLFSLTPYGPNFRGGIRVATADMNGDGQEDIITAPGYVSGTGGSTAPLIKVFDGITGQEIDSFLAFESTWTRGIFVAAGDVNNDGTPDIVVARDAGSTPDVRVFDGKTHFQIASFQAYESSFRGGVRVAVGDVVAADGHADIIVAPGSGRLPTVRVFDGFTVGSAKVVMDREFNAFETSFRRGLFVAAGSLNDDSFADIIVSPDSGRSSAEIRLFDGASGDAIEPLTKIIASGEASGSGQIFTDSRWTTGVRVSVADLNGDGIDEVVAAPGASRTPFISLYDTKTGLKVAPSFLVFDQKFLGGVYVG